MKADGGGKIFRPSRLGRYREPGFKRSDREKEGVGQKEGIAPATNVHYKLISRKARGGRLASR